MRAAEVQLWTALLSGVVDEQVVPGMLASPFSPTGVNSLLFGPLLRFVLAFPFELFTFCWYSAPFPEFQVYSPILRRGTPSE